MGTSELDQASLTQPHNVVKQSPQLQTELHESETRLKCSENLRSAVRTAFSGDLRFMFLMILSVVPLCAFMIFYETQLQKLMHSLPDLLDFSPRIVFIQLAPSGDISSSHSETYQHDVSREVSFYDLIKLCLFYLILYPPVELFTIFITVKCMSKKHFGGETHSGFKQVFCQNNVEGMFVTYLCVHLLSALTLLGIFWELVLILVKHFISSNWFWSPYYYFDPTLFCANVLYIGFHSAVIILLLYKFLSWSAYWNLSMVISILEEEPGFGAFGLADYYGKHYKQTGFQLMLVFFTFCNFLRLPAALIFGFSLSFAGICVTGVVMGLFCLGSLVKWVAFVLYFYECKQKVMEKKGDEEVRKSADAC